MTKLKNKEQAEKHKSYTDILETLSRNHDRSRVFHDFLMIVVCCLSMQQKEDVYLATIRKYTKEEIAAFAEALATMVLWMENHPLEDALGDYFQTYISHGHNCQLFTPQHICDLMAAITNPGEGDMYDPCCGSGRFFLSSAKVSRNHQFIGADISEMCCLMTLINMCLNDLTGEVRHMNSLSLETWRVWQVVRYPIIHLPYIRELKIELKPTHNDSGETVD